MLKTKVPKTTSSTLINAAKLAQVLRSQSLCVRVCVCVCVCVCLCASVRPETTSSTLINGSLINYAKVLRSQTRTSVDAQPSRAAQPSP